MNRDVVIPAKEYARLREIQWRIICMFLYVDGFKDTDLGKRLFELIKGAEHAN